MCEMWADDWTRCERLAPRVRVDQTSADRPLAQSVDSRVALEVRVTLSLAAAAAASLNRIANESAVRNGFLSSVFPLLFLRALVASLPSSTSRHFLSPD